LNNNRKSNANVEFKLRYISLVLLTILLAVTSLDSITATIDCQMCFRPRPGDQVTSQNGLNFIEQNEGTNASPNSQGTCGPRLRTSCHVTHDHYGLYQDSAGFCTQGIGHLVENRTCSRHVISDYNNGQYHGAMTRAQTLDLFGQDVKTAEGTINQGVNVALTQYQFDSLVDFTFNEGGHNFLLSHLLRDINAGNCDPDTITNDFAQWERYGNDAHARHIRRVADTNLFNNGVYR
jgi:GH24 family phage-related lysozyme (muramidase)